MNDSVNSPARAVSAWFRREYMNDSVNSPAHYTDGGIETIDFIEAKGLNYNLGNAVKYISRAGKKDPDKVIEDLRKAEWYLTREIYKREIAEVSNNN